MANPPHPATALTAIGVALLLTGCGPTPRLSQEKIAKIRQGNPGITEACLNKLKFGGETAFPDRVDQCFKMEPAKRWRGLWRASFELSLFCPDLQSKCDDTSSGEKIWLTNQSKADFRHTDRNGSLYQLDFIGRKTAQRGFHGHLSSFDHEIVVDRLIGIKQIEPGLQ